MTGIVLSGGRGRRISASKGLLQIEGEPVIQIILGKLAEVFTDLIIVTNSPCEYEAFGVRCVEDLVAGKGPLGGIYSGLVASDTGYSFVVANDMPFLDSDLIRHVVDRRDGFQAVVPRIGSLVEPLHALYSKGCVQVIENHLRANDLKVRSFLGEVTTGYIEEEEIREFGDPETIFFNINRKDDMEAARMMASRRGE